VNQFGDYRQKRQGKHCYLGKDNTCDHYENSNNDNGQIRVAPFGSFATQEVCTFASDVDMCVWGVVKEEHTPELEFIASDNKNECDGSDEDLDDNSGHILRENGLVLTESSLLRTMDAMQAAAHSEYERTEGRPVSVDTSEQQESSEPNNLLEEASSKADECLFFIDRAGEGVESDYNISAEAVEKTISEEGVRDQGVNSDEKTKNAIKNQPSQSELRNIGEGYCNDITVGTFEKFEKDVTSDFRFVIDVEGVKEFGGDLKDLNESNEQSCNKNHEKKSKEKIWSYCAKNEQNDAGKESQTYLKVNPYVKKNSPPKESDDRISDTQFEELEEGTFSAFGDSMANAIGVHDESSSNDEIIIDDDDDDSADKLSTFYSRQEAVSDNDTGDNIEKQTSNVFETGLSCDSENSVEEIINSITNHSEKALMELSLTSDEQNPEATSNSILKPSFGPTGKTRNKVISVLRSLTNHLRKSSFTHTIECRSRAKVPIINCSTRTGFEGDIAIGGHNGVDTSHYAFSQVNRFISFAPTVLLLKIVMFQQGLDKPFTGGLGSYKLYVLVAYHIEQHIARGGKDRPSEILISLLFRYGRVDVCDKMTTDLESIKIRQDLISSDGGICDLSNAFRIADCVGMFNECYKRLLERVDHAGELDKTNGGGNFGSVSYLSSIVDCFRLKQARDASERRSSFCDGIRRPTARDDPGKVNHVRRIGQIFTKHGLNQTPQNSKRTSITKNESSSKKARLSNDLQIPSSKGNFKRGPRGGIIPSIRPDIEAMQSLRSKPESELMLRASKNRKNKKKQTRDTALRNYASRNSF